MTSQRHQIALNQSISQDFSSQALSRNHALPIKLRTSAIDYDYSSSTITFNLHPSMTVAVNQGGQTMPKFSLNARPKLLNYRHLPPPRRNTKSKTRVKKLWTIGAPFAENLIPRSELINKNSYSSLKRKKIITTLPLFSGTFNNVCTEVTQNLIRRQK
jgi:hypothetical protein